MRKGFLFLLVFSLITACTGNKKTSSWNQDKDMKTNAPTYLYKVLSMEDWGKSCKTIHLSNMDREFIHFSTEDQLDRILKKFWGNSSRYIVLKLETEKLVGKLVLEANPGGTNKYYHLYGGSIPLIAVLEMKVHHQ